MNTTLKVRRHELKFYISRSDYEYAKSILSELMQKDNHQAGDEGYFIRSLYFDDAIDTSVAEKLSGVEFRDKYRLRIYEFDQNWVKLERKRKTNQYVDKTSVIITRDEAHKLIDGDVDFILEKDNLGARSLYFDFKTKYLHPVVIVDYFRDVFMLDYNDIRITFDKHLRSNTSSLDLFDADLVTHPLQRPDVIEMEVKFNHFLPSWFKDFLHFDGAINLAISKYCHGRMYTREYYHD